MSLVNNMLRDLDQRRKSNATSPSLLTLTPASDGAEHGNRQTLILLVLVILIATVIASYYFGYFGAVNTSETLNRRPALTVQAPRIDSPVIEQGEREIVIEEPETLAPVSDANSTEQAAQNVAATATPVPASNSAADLALETRQINEESVAGTTETSAQNPAARTEVIPAGTQQQVAARLESPTSARNPDGTSSTSDSQGSPVVKSNAQMSAQELDVQNVQNALSLFNSNQTDAAFNLLSRYVTMNPDAHQSRETYAKLLISQGALEEANRMVDEGLTLAPNRSAYKKIKARILMANSEYAQAAALLNNRAPVLNTDLEYHDMLATAQLAGGDYSNAIATYTSLIRFNSSEGKWWYGIAAAYDGLNDANAATQAYNQALQTVNLSGALRQRSQRRIVELRQ